MSANWILVDADFGRYHHTKFKSGGRLYFIKAGRKNVSVYDIALRKNVSIKMSAIPRFYYDLDFNQLGHGKASIHQFPLKTWKSILKTFRVYKQKTTVEKNILDALKNILDTLKNKL
tara:strand:- start:502 stop:852 length:351 start_codon:yes stop_codon:yes gene_type:complete